MTKGETVICKRCQGLGRVDRAAYRDEPEELVRCKACEGTGRLFEVSIAFRWAWHPDKSVDGSGYSEIWKILQNLYR